MKPSERLQQITDELVEDVRARTTPENFEKYSAVYRERARFRALAMLLDELFDAERFELAPTTAEALAKRTMNLHERLKKIEGDEPEKALRRLALWSALAVIGPGCQAEHINPFLEAAGVEWRCVNGDEYEFIRQRILDTGRKEGLL